MDSVAPEPITPEAQAALGALTDNPALGRVQASVSENGKEESFERVGRYELVRKIATGGMAELFLARFRGPGGFEKRCALKRILPQFVEDDDFKRMFMNEARVAAMFEHPNLVHIMELGQDSTTRLFYIAMELINGMDLRQLANLTRDRGQSIPPELATWMMASALDGLAYAHEFKDESGQPLNLVHRDVSPQNILVSYEGALKVVDFGIVKASSNDGQTQTGMLKGKIAYMSPEQATGEKLDARSDIFAVGICLYELVAGVKPFRGPNEIMTLRAILENDPQPITDHVPDCPRGIERAINRALAKRRDDRYQSAREFSDDLAAVLRETPTPINRRVLSDFINSLTEGGTDRFDSTKLKIPRAPTSFQPGADPTPGPRFAGSATAGMAPMEDATAIGRPQSNLGGPPAPYQPPEQAQLPPEPLAHAGVDATPSGVHASAVHAAGVQAPAALAQPMVATNPAFPGGEMSLDTAVRDAGVSSKGPMIAAIVVLCLALIGGIGWYTSDPGTGKVVTTPIAGAPTPAAPTPAAPTPAPAMAAPTPEPAKPAVAARPEPKPAAAKPKPKRARAKPKRRAAAKPKPKPKPVAAAVAPTPPPSEPPPPAAKPMGRVTITSVPRGLTVKLKGKSLGRTPLSAEAIPAGAHTLVLTNPKLGIRRTLSVSIDEGQTVEKKVTVGKATLKANSRPWSTVFVNGREWGKTPLQRPIYEGKHEVKLVSSGDGQERIQKVVIKAGEEKSIRVKF